MGCLVPSKYNHWGKVGTDKNILFNLVTSSVALFRDGELGQILQADFIDGQLADQALQNGFVVPSEENEVEKVLAVERMNNYSTRFAGFQILPTTDCNARCWYCYERSFEKKTMPKNVLDSIPSFIEPYMDMVDDIHVTWFGGEPLLGFDSMCGLSDELIGISASHGVGYTSDIITNATLLTPGMIDVLVGRCRIGQAQVTLDGIGAEHIARKRYLDESITFDNVMSAMDLLVNSGIRLLIRINVDKSNTRDCIELIDCLAEKWAMRDNVMLYVAPLYGSSGVSFYGRDELNNLYRVVFKSMIDSGWIRTLDGLPMNFNNATCSARMINNFVIAPNGDVFKCEHLLSCPAEKVGTVFDGVVFNEAMARWSAPSEPNKCTECSYLPTCHGGCYAAEKLNFGFERCPHIAFVTDAIIEAAGYLLEKQEKEDKQ